ncbi:MAG: 4-(cytidine 5'-diphospho)-2-C-methyl-D-erythritol kinase [Reinekea sp.]
MTSTILTLPAPAKLNLFLHIVGRRQDGYHELQTIFQILDLCDTMQFQKKENSGLTFRCSDPALETDDNLVIRAVRALEEISEQTLNVDIYLDKKLPLGGGIGGGSSDCATTLLALNHLFDLRLATQQLLMLGKALGADVPVFIHGRTTWAEGIGEKLTDIELPDAHYVLVHPNEHVSTAALFNHPELTRDTPLSTIRPALAETGRNDFEQLIRKLYPSIDQAFQNCRQFGSPRLTGTGACFFIQVPDESAARESAETIQQQFPSLTTWATRSVSVSTVFQQLSNR